jgi:hypothetical protein
MRYPWLRALFPYFAALLAVSLAVPVRASLPVSRVPTDGGAGRPGGPDRLQYLRGAAIDGSLSWTRQPNLQIFVGFDTQFAKK